MQKSLLIRLLDEMTFKVDWKTATFLSLKKKKREKAKKAILLKSKYQTCDWKRNKPPCFHVLSGNVSIFLFEDFLFYLP